MRDSYLRDLLNLETYNKIYAFTYLTDFKNKVTKKFKISICTTCMDRLDDIKQTYMKNIEDNIGYGNIEFILLNYNSKDNLDYWVKSNLINFINSGLVVYYKTTEPKYYSMTHSRNIAFKLATGDIVNNVDGDHFTNKGFVEHINFLANQKHKKMVFVKSRQKNRGRLGFFKKDFMWLGGYNEEINGYGFDDEDLIARAFHAGLTLVKFGGEYCSLTKDHKRHVGNNYEEKDWKYNQRKNTLISLLNLYYKRVRANQGQYWGKAKLIKNFKEEIET